MNLELKTDIVKLKAIAPTLLKNKWLDSSLLDSSELKSADINHEYEGKYLELYPDKKHLKVEINGFIWFVFLPHWELLNIFPTGVKKPQITKQYLSKTDMVEAIVNYCLDVGLTNRKYIAYILSTAENEANFIPQKEIRGYLLSRDQKKYWDTGYYGRGLIQVTWEKNYRLVSQKLGIDLLKNPDEMLTYPVAIASLVIGMIEGWYTGYKLTSFRQNDYWNMRRIVNPGEVKWKKYFPRASKFVDSAHKWEDYLANYSDMYKGIA